MNFEGVRAEEVNSRIENEIVKLFEYNVYNNTHIEAC